MPTKYKAPKAPKPRPGGVWLFVPDDEMTEEQKQENLEADMDAVTLMLTTFCDYRHPFALAEQFKDYFPGSNEVPQEGSWIMVKNPPHTEYTVPPLSFWFAEPWPMQNPGRHKVHRVKIVTPKGDLGLWPHEYSRVTDPSKYYEFIDSGEMEAKFFGSEEGIPADKLFYLRSRGIAKKDAIIMLIGSVMAHGVLWLETARPLCEHLGYKWPNESILATHVNITVT